MEEEKKWVIFNWGEKLEFAECPDCGYEFDHDTDAKIWYRYPTRCPKCGAIMTGTVEAEEG